MRLVVNLIMNFLNFLKLCRAVSVNGGTDIHLFIKRSSFVFRRWTDVLRVWNDI